jgi:hypothetical protein
VFQAVASSPKNYIADIGDVELCISGICHLKTALKTSPAISRICVFSRDESAFIAGISTRAYRRLILRSKITIGESHQVIHSQKQDVTRKKGPSAHCGLLLQAYYNCPCPSTSVLPTRGKKIRPVIFNRGSSNRFLTQLFGIFFKCRKY